MWKQHLGYCLLQNCHLSVGLDKYFPSIYNLIDHEANRLCLESPLTETKPSIEKIRSFRNADYGAIIEFLVEKPFQAICYTNINKIEQSNSQCSFYMSREEQGIDNQCHLGFNAQSLVEWYQAKFASMRAGKYVEGNRLVRVLPNNQCQQVPKHSLENLHFSKNTINNIINDIDDAESRGPNGIPPGYYVKATEDSAISCFQAFGI